MCLTGDSVISFNGREFMKIKDISKFDKHIFEKELQYDSKMVTEKIPNSDIILTEDRFVEILSPLSEIMFNIQKGDKKFEKKNLKNIWNNLIEKYKNSLFDLKLLPLSFNVENSTFKVLNYILNQSGMLNLLSPNKKNNNIGGIQVGFYNKPDMNKLQTEIKKLGFKVSTFKKKNRIIKKGPLAALLYSILLISKSNPKKILTVNKKSLKISPSTFYNWFSRDLKKNEYIYEITTITGKKIKATGNHPFLTPEKGMVKVEDLFKNKDNFRLYVNPTLEFIEKKEVRSITILTEDSFLNKFKKIPNEMYELQFNEERILKRKRTTKIRDNISREEIKNKWNNIYLPKYIKELKDLKLLPLKINDPKVLILCRIIGSIVTNGSLEIKAPRKIDSNNVLLEFYSYFSLSTDRDCLELQNDFKLLGFNIPKSSDENFVAKDSETGRITTHKVKKISKSGSFACLIYALGISYGKKTQNCSNIFPKFIMKCNNLCKREYLGGLLGGDGSKVYLDKKKQNFFISKFSMRKYVKNDSIKLEEQFYKIKELFDEFEISAKTSVQEYHDLIVIKNDEIKRRPRLIKTISENKKIEEIQSKRICIKNDEIIKKTDSYYIISIEFGRSNENTIKIGSKIGYRYANIKENVSNLHIAYLNYRNTFKDDKIMEFEKFKSIVLTESYDSNILAEPIYKIEKTNLNEKVYDFTTASNNHTFIANSFIVSNCSGDGTLRKAADLWRRYKISDSYSLHKMQVKVSMRAVHLLQINGTMVYSTCSLNPSEDEAVVAEILRLSKGTIELVDCENKFKSLKYSKGLSTWKLFSNELKEYTSPDDNKRITKSMFPPTEEEARKFNLNRSMRFLPHYMNTGGFFVAVFKKIKEFNIKEEKNVKQEIIKYKGKSSQNDEYAFIKEDLILPL